MGNREKNKHAMCKKRVFDALERVEKGIFSVKTLKYGCCEQ
ncbi:hypothetical protein HMPREF9019_1608 [Hoylesella timonensis CRIS 5C-B1]|uniref:Uncharacterized protein n=1 Tax=Hoylesella timonensis CRIS 5C-B1 TaxID=679189 RepID=D1W1Q1_9BACT|nr:hypothetical protein HMPREF9019_1608 [Hoylesella timonensis CRIS 5C-B1]